jgi:hypothetical protein
MLLRVIILPLLQTLPVVSQSTDEKSDTGESDSDTGERCTKVKKH